MRINLILIIAVVLLLACNDNESTKETVVTLIEKPLLTAETNKKHIEKGKEIAQKAFIVLSGNVKQAMANGGIENALTYCNINAGGLMDSLSNYYRVTIKRTSRKTRNQTNNPTTEEKVVLDKYLEMKNKGKEMSPIISFLANGDTVFYAPIIMQPLCVSCHGTVGENISKENYAIIKNYYTTDKAIDFKAGDLRGIWSITFNKGGF
ncbi:MAG: hypothetical protein COX70_00945 [Flavobacteriales bacterium CG_4_10_14_0_2_um_filter_32_8]|nr:MAG: hypothetical protein AUJ97_00435 [Bacteroidetes bacterium CG2_30_32_10]PJA09745.1 MAG: hypothetical protein COX70_00945 [Flavobacteriales bacterium CG_4_10_14_0_2_um_filter_32_8]PJB14419.1 MAG: hypothetical protein CO118_08680 [Flavobacteriales bacterium CG_4_9_14_3_um_filter_32_8]